MARPVIALLTDFGTRDHYVGVMKGVILGICPEATLVDITHGVPPQDVTAGALELAAAAPFFPPRTVFLTVVDPGVGSSRRAVAIESGGRLFVGPDNGLLWLATAATGAFAAVSIESPEHARPTVSRTFEGRDRFAPAAAWLATGVPLTALGPPVRTLTPLGLPEAVAEGDVARGVVVRVDHFGNLITNITRPLLAGMQGPGTVVRIAGARIDAMVTTYAEAPEGSLCALFSSTGHLEIAVRGGSAAALLGADRGAVVQVHRRSTA
jgi:S-adenosyl-L-methionine hydrolase (adenosine-forming)